MAVTVRSIIVTSVPALAALIGLFWFFKKKKDDAFKPKQLDQLKKESKANDTSKVSVPDGKRVPVSSIASDQIPLCSQVMPSVSNPKLESTNITASRDEPPDKEAVSDKDDIKRTLSVNKQNELCGSRNKDNGEEPSNNNHQSIPLLSTVDSGSVSSAKDEEDQCQESPQSVIRELGQGDGSPLNPINLESNQSGDNIKEVEEILITSCTSSQVDCAQPFTVDDKTQDHPFLKEVNNEPINLDGDSIGINETEDKVHESILNKEESSQCMSSTVPNDDFHLEEEKVEKMVCDNGVKSEDLCDIATGICNDIISSVEEERINRENVDLDSEETVEKSTEQVNGSMSPSSLGLSSVGSPVETATVNGSHSDALSEHSADSGNGSSIVDSQQPAPSSEIVEYCFDFPAEICGMLIGRKGSNIKHVKEGSGCDITVKDKLYTPDYKLIVLEGTKRSVDKCLEMIKKRFPAHKFGPIDFSPAAPENPVLVPEIMQLSLPDGVYMDVNVSSVVTANHLFLQQPTHPSFYMLEKQNSCMLMCYAQDGIVPQLPRPVEVGMICAAPMFNGWYRAQVVNGYEDTDESDIKYVDYGGYAKVHNCVLRQIRSDFTTLPFQAVECYLANVVPPKDESMFPPEANAVLEELVHHQLLQAEVVAYEEDGVPYVNLYKTLPDSSMFFINRELVNRGVARWVEQSL